MIKPKKMIFCVGINTDLSACIVKPKEISNCTVSLMLSKQSE